MGGHLDKGKKKKREFLVLARIQKFMVSERMCHTRACTKLLLLRLEHLFRVWYSQVTNADVIRWQ